MTSLLSQINPGLLLIVVGFIGCLVPVQRVRQAMMVATPVIGVIMLALADRGTSLAVANVMGIDL
ncbi:MAG: Na(+)/H(+) antiporter subunit D, partial [Henriciella sp.]